jgi:class 3 adenylate cyclase
VGLVVATLGGAGVRCAATTPTGVRDQHAWLVRYGPLDRVGVEGTGAYGAGLARFLRSRDLVVIEVDRPNMAARVAAAANANQVLVSSLVYELTRTLGTFRFGEPLSVSLSHQASTPVSQVRKPHAALA